MLPDCFDFFRAAASCHLYLARLYTVSLLGFVRFLRKKRFLLFSTIWFRTKLHIPTWMGCILHQSSSDEKQREIVVVVVFFFSSRAALLSSGSHAVSINIRQFHHENWGWLLCPRKMNAMMRCGCCRESGDDRFER